MEIKLYSTHCPKCLVLEKKLTKKDIKFIIVDNTDEVLKVGKENHIMSAPILQVGDQFMDFTKANNWVNEQK